MRKWLGTMRRWRNETGATLSLELVFLMCGVGAGIWAAAYVVYPTMIEEMSDVGSAVGSLDQTYSTSGMTLGHPDANTPVAVWAGSAFTDNADFCDQGCDCGVVMCIPPGGPEAHSQ